MIATDDTHFRMFTRAYLEAILFAESDMMDGDDDHSLQEKGYTIDDFEVDSIIKATSDCQLFALDNVDLLCGEDPEEAGANFFFTRSGHGTGFWDSDEWDKSAEELTEKCNTYGAVNAGISDGKVFLSDG